MISPRNQKVIQIEVTNVCPHQCSNCTRFCGHHKKPFLMGLPDFKAAVDSLDGYTGMVGVMGGEPTLHPKFEEMARYIHKKRPDTVPADRSKPIEDFAGYRNKNLSSMRRKRGLWSSLGLGYYRHHETIQDVFGYQCLNDHRHAGEHMALLMPRKELGIPDAEWIKYRDACWLQRAWSSSITPKGAFFCEVAAALDMLFDGPGGWDVEPRWWRRSPKDFGKQLEWCEMCSACLPVPSLKATEKTDIVSPAMAVKLRSMGSRKRMIVFDPKAYSTDQFEVNRTCEPYLPEEGNSARVAGTEASVHVQHLEAIVVCVGYDDYLDETLSRNCAQLDSITVVTDNKDPATVRVARKYGANVFISPRIHERGAPFAKGKAINDVIDYLRAEGHNDWILHLDADVILPPNFRESLSRYVLNPGCLYYTRRWGLPTYAGITEFLERIDVDPWPTLFAKYGNKMLARKEARKGNDLEHLPFGYFQLFNLRAQALRGRERVYCEGSRTAENDDLAFGFETFPEEKTASLPIPEFDVVHLPHGCWQENWHGRRSVRLREAKDPGFVLSNVYTCVRDCQWKGRMYLKGETVITDRWDVPRHFLRESL